MDSADTPTAPKHAVGTAVVIKGAVVEVEGDTVVVETDAVDIPGSPGYQQRIRLHANQVEA